MGSGHFPRETQPLLAHLCAVVVSLRDVSAALREFGPGVPSGASWKRYRDLIKLRTALAAQLASFSTKLRITKTSRDVRGRLTTAYERHSAQPSPKPWNDDALPPLRTNDHKGE
jgi:hypothetical protein